MQILEMGARVEKMIDQSIQALKTRDLKQANAIIESDKEIDQLELKINEQCINLLALYQPEASDLRFITMAMLINNDLERIADLAVNICQRVLELADKPLVKPLVDIPKLARLTQDMVKGSLDAFTQKDTSLARAIRSKDDEVDRLRDAVQKELIAIMKKDPSKIDHAIPLLLIARHLERIGDHATNIAEDVVYMVEASVIRHAPRDSK